MWAHNDWFGYMIIWLPARTLHMDQRFLFGLFIFTKWIDVYVQMD